MALMLLTLQRTWNILSYIILFKNKNNSSETVWAGGLGHWILLELCFEVVPWYFCFCLQVLSRALMYIPQLGKYAESILENGSSSGRKLAKLQRIARQAVAALCALGGFKETIKIGSEVQVIQLCSHLISEMTIAALLRFFPALGSLGAGCACGTAACGAFFPKTPPCGCVCS